MWQSMKSKLFDSTLDIKPDKPINDEKTKGIFIIGAGFGRTGTSSLQIALNELGWRSFHMREALKNRNKMHLFIKAAETKLKLKEKMIRKNEKNDWSKYILNKNDFNWNDIFETDKNRYNASVDFPACAFYLDLMKYYEPNYRVILTIRDNENKWYKSVKSTIAEFEQLQCDSWFFRRIVLYPQYKMQAKCTGDIIFNGKYKQNVYDDEENAKKVYNEWIECVKQNVPKDKLLIFNVKEGWKPLCQFLGIDDIPNKPFPRSNESKKMIQGLNAMKLVHKIIRYGVVIIIAFVLYVIMRYAL